MFINNDSPCSAFISSFFTRFTTIAKEVKDRLMVDGGSQVSRSTGNVNLKAQPPKRKSTCC